MAINIIDVGLKFKTKFVDRTTTRRIILHHTGVVDRQTVQIINALYQSRTDANFNGIGYHYYINQDGQIYLGRPENAVGAHCSNHNNDSIGICFEGNFNLETMSESQLDAGIQLLVNILERHGKLIIQMHSDVVNTSSPGKNFPYDKLVVNALNPTSFAATAVIPPPESLTISSEPISPVNELLLPDIVEIYIVQDNDTLTSISGRFGTRTELLLLANKHISNTNLVISGQTINIPAPTFEVGNHVAVDGTAKKSSSGLGRSISLKGQKFFIIQYLKQQSFPYGVATSPCNGEAEFYVRADVLAL